MVLVRSKVSCSSKFLFCFHCCKGILLVAIAFSVTSLELQMSGDHSFAHFSTASQSAQAAAFFFRCKKYNEAWNRFCFISTFCWVPLPPARSDEVRLLCWIFQLRFFSIDSCVLWISELYELCRFENKSQEMVKNIYEHLSTQALRKKLFDNSDFRIAAGGENSVGHVWLPRSSTVIRNSSHTSSLPRLDKHSPAVQIRFRLFSVIA